MTNAPAAWADDRGPLRALHGMGRCRATRNRCAFEHFRNDRGKGRLLEADLEQRPKETQPLDRIVELEAMLLVRRLDRQQLRKPPRHPPGVVRVALQ